MSIPTYFKVLVLYVSLTSLSISSMIIPCGPASRNKYPILDVLKDELPSLLLKEGSAARVLEIASGTGEHAAFFCQNIQNLIYQPTEPDTSLHESIRTWSKDLPCVFPPIALDVRNFESDLIFPEALRNKHVDMVICINMIHIAPFACTEALFRLSRGCVRKGGIIVTYGPYRVDGFMTESNIQFDANLRSRCHEWGIRDREEVLNIAAKYNFRLDKTVEMPASNLALVFRNDSE